MNFLTVYGCDYEKKNAAAVPVIAVRQCHRNHNSTFAFFGRLMLLIFLLISVSRFQRLRMMIKPLVLVKVQENGPDQQTENQSQNPATEEAYI